MIIEFVSGEIIGTGSLLIPLLCKVGIAPDDFSVWTDKLWIELAHVHDFLLLHVLLAGRHDKARSQVVFLGIAAGTVDPAELVLMFDDLFGRYTVLDSLKRGLFLCSWKGIVPPLKRDIPGAVQMVHESEGHHVVTGVTIKDCLLIRIPAFQLVCCLDVFVFHNRLFPFHILAIGDFRVWAVEMSGAYGTCIALGF